MRSGRKEGMRGWGRKERRKEGRKGGYEEVKCYKTSLKDFIILPSVITHRAASKQ